MKEFLTFALLVLAVRELHSAEVDCERKENYEWPFVGSVKTCFMQTMTIIKSTGMLISPIDETIGGLSMLMNKKIHFLPEKLAETFPTLLFYGANECSITEVSKVNFVNLGKLRILYLHYNQIVTIASNTFEDLKSLEILTLRHNHIIFINGEVFQKLNKFAKVSLDANVCINENFNYPSRIAAMPQIVTQKCGFHATVFQMFEKLLEGQKKQFEMETFMNKTILKKEICQSEMNALNLIKTIEMTKLVKETQDQCHSQFALFRDFSEKLFNETLSARTQHCTEMVDLKTSEIENLLAELQNKTEELNDKDLKIKSLEERIKVWNGQNQW